MSIKLIKKLIKASPLGGFATWIGDIYSDPRSINISRLKNANHKTAVLLGTPTHHNIGDYLIAYNEEYFLKNSCKYSSVIEILTRIFFHNTSIIAKNLDVSVPIFIAGGGWMGDL